MPYSIVFREGAEHDFTKLDRSIRYQVIKKLERLKDNPFLGQELGNKMGIDLTGFYKLYVVKKKIRIVYSVIEKRLVIEVISIGKREKASAYKTAWIRSKNEE